LYCATRAREELLRARLDDVSKEDSKQAVEAVKAELAKVLAKVPKSDTKPPAAIEEQVSVVKLSGGGHRVSLEFTGDRLDREVSVVYRATNGALALLSQDTPIRFTEKGWSEWAQAQRLQVKAVVEEVQRPLRQKWEQY
jgi:hypothetical protein